MFLARRVVLTDACRASVPGWATKLNWSRDVARRSAAVMYMFSGPRRRHPTFRGSYICFSSLLLGTDLRVGITVLGVFLRLELADVPYRTGTHTGK